MPDTAYAWAPITKTIREDDGTLLVYGPAASSDLDRDQQRLNAAWLDQAMPRWLGQGGAVREQHDSKRAVGIGVGLSKTETGAHLLTARIVDPVAVKKIEHGVLKGFSVGIKNPKIVMGKADAPGGEVVAGDVIEVSVVDRPCNPTTLFEIAKADGSGDLTAVEDPQIIDKTDTFGLAPELYERLDTPVKEALAALAEAGAQVAADVDKTDQQDAQPVVVNVTVKTNEPDLVKDYNTAERKQMASSGAAMADGSYPIKTKADLRKAIRAVGRGNADHNAIRKHIITRAKALGLESMVPDNWNADGSLKGSSEKADTIAQAEQILRQVRALAPELAKADGPDDGDGENETSDIDGATAAIAAIAKLIISEAEELATGRLEEACDIALLLDAVRSLAWFKQREEQQQDGDDDDAMGLADTAKRKKKTTAPADDGDEADDEEDEDDGEDGKKPTARKSDEPMLTKADIADMVKSAVAEAGDAYEERVKALEADLAKAHSELDTIKAMPQPGGPVLTRTQAQETAARKSDADRLRAEARHYLAKAEQVEDRDLRDGYREKARTLLAKADA